MKWPLRPFAMPSKLGSREGLTSFVDEISVAEEVVRARGAWGDGNGSDQLTGGEREDAQQQVVRLWSRLDVANKVSLLHCRPAFFGCGMVDACEGDVLLDDALYEIKAGDRQIRSI